MPWAGIRGHDDVVETLRATIARGRFPHALLFVGPAGVGKRAFALALAQALFCEHNAEEALLPCGACFGCRQVRAGSHPDLLMVAKPEDKHELPIELIRQLCLDLGRTPLRGRRRMAIVDDVDDLSPEAANAFLKTLEEPPPGAVLVLIGTSPELQLDTVRSRCRVVRFGPLSARDIAAILVDEGTVADRAEAGRLADQAGGSLARARALADPELAGFHQELIEEVARGFEAAGLGKRVEAFVNEAGKESAVKRARASDVVDELARFFQDVLHATLSVPGRGLDGPGRRAAVALAQRLDTDDAIELADRCLLAHYHLERRAHVGLTLDALLHDLGECINRLAR